jgi:hypothetical protein
MRLNYSGGQALASSIASREKMDTSEIPAALLGFQPEIALSVAMVLSEIRAAEIGASKMMPIKRP